MCSRSRARARSPGSRATSRPTRSIAGRCSAPRPTARSGSATNGSYAEAPRAPSARGAPLRASKIRPARPRRHGVFAARISALVDADLTDAAFAPKTGFAMAAHHLSAARRVQSRARFAACLGAQRGDTLIEVMVAALLVALIATASLTGYTAVGHA